MFYGNFFQQYLLTFILCNLILFYNKMYRLGYANDKILSNG